MTLFRMCDISCVPSSSLVYRGMTACEIKLKRSWKLCGCFVSLLSLMRVEGGRQREEGARRVMCVRQSEDQIKVHEEFYIGTI